ncbi:hypothetical protein CALCODRAFT_502804 [Calocera cornea HHB12733]|uniref:Uncharacterized protein n=1 Tax=Calocera cornea HHB12733 TaxID=1353952 RepID=A0A165D444_9BASI|nr:hypothetical protein CALCODRAFT_502804 [Calocera cornea HHB12733]
MRVFMIILSLALSLTCPTFTLRPTSSASRQQATGLAIAHFHFSFRSDDVDSQKYDPSSCPRHIPPVFESIHHLAAELSPFLMRLVAAAARQLPGCLED